MGEQSVSTCLVCECGSCNPGSNPQYGSLSTVECDPQTKLTNNKDCYRKSPGTQGRGWAERWKGKVRILLRTVSAETYISHVTGVRGYHGARKRSRHWRQVLGLVGLNIGSFGGLRER